MFNRRSEGGTALTSPLPGPRRVAWLLWSAAGTIAIIALLAWVGEDNRSWSDGTWDDWMWGRVQDLTGWVAQVCGGVGRVFGGNGGLPLGQRIGFFAVVLLVLYLCWRATLAWLAYKPGPVDVQELVDATPVGRLEVPVGDLTAELRRLLSDSSMYAPTTLPAEAPPTSFLDLVGDIDLGPAKLGTALPRMLSRLRPKLAYRVGGVLRMRSQEPDNVGVTVTVTAYVFGGSRSTTIWATDWDEAIRRSGYWVISSLLPVTRAGRRPPWRKWWGRELCPDLFEAFQHANELSRAGHYHEALPQYYEAIALDPHNPYLRGELAEVQERTGLHIDALDTCQRALTLDGQTFDQYNKRLWQSRWDPHLRRLRYLLHPRLYAEGLGLRYRNAVILGCAEQTAKQWFARSGAKNKATTDRLASLLAERYWPAARDLPFAGEDEQVWLEKALNSSGSDASERLVRVVFQRAALQEFKRLAADDSWARLAGLYWPARLWSLIGLASPFAGVQSIKGPRQPVTRGAFRVNREVWAPLRLAWADRTRGLHGPDELVKRIGRAQSRLVVLRRVWPGWRHRDWLTHYNSACAYAIAATAVTDRKQPGATSLADDDPDVERYVQQAVEEFEQAVLMPRRGVTTVERTWLVHEDPDLNLLRGHPLFQDLLRTAYPGVETPDQSSPRNWAADQRTDYDFALLAATAELMHEVWHLRGANSRVELRVAAEWLRAEDDIWNWIRIVATDEDHTRWDQRVELIRSVQANALETLPVTPSFPPAMPSNETTPAADGSHDECLAGLKRELAAGRGRRKRRRNSPSLKSRQGQDVLLTATADGVAPLSREAVHRLSSGYAAVWQTLGEWLGQGHGDERSFHKALGRVPQPTRRRRAVVRRQRKIVV
ncbi:tetratricopeptide repeat protein [Streptomyces sp. NPDC060035]|uniref:tetratricopeptide repeat protein n=1 Tax=Streptomyces sp. NPDC060035 TaxID=3347044 RepID=UPI0036B07D78